MSWPQIEKSQDYLLSEQGAVLADWGGRLPIVLAYPNSYRVGMSSLALHGLYQWFNDLPGVICERTFAFLDKHERQDVPLITSNRNDLWQKRPFLLLPSPLRWIIFILWPCCAGHACRCELLSAPRQIHLCYWVGRPSRPIPQ